MTGHRILLVHGASHRGSSWSLLQRELLELGIPSRTVDLPSASEDLGDLRADSDVVRSAVDGLGPVTVVCHSYGGMPTTQGLAGARNVVRIVYLAAYLPTVGESLLDLVDARGAEEDTDWILSEDGRTIAAADPERLFYNRCLPERAAAAVLELAPQSFPSFEQRIDVAAGGGIPSTYIMCTDDRAIPLHVQRRLADRAGTVLAIDSDHSPFLSMPEELARILAAQVGDDAAGTVSGATPRSTR